MRAAAAKVSPEAEAHGKKKGGEAPAFKLDLLQAEGLEVINMTGEKVKLASFWKDQKLVIVFLRRFDCQTCFSYIVLFAHLRPILTATNTRIIFLTCHENLSEVQVFLSSFAYWLRTLQSPDEREEEVRRKVGVGTKLGALPGDLFLDPGRNAYRVFGIGNQLWTYQRLALMLKLRFWLKSGGLNKFRKVKRGGRRMKTYTETSRAVWREWFQRSSRPTPSDLSLYAQSPGIVVMENGKMLYKFVCTDQVNAVPKDPNASFAEALACRREDIQTLDEDVQRGLEKFLNLVADPSPTKIKVRSNELVLEKILGSGKESEVFKAAWMGIPVAVKYFRTVPSFGGRREGGEEGEEDVDAESIQSFSNEVSMLMSLRHRNVITMMGFGVQSPNFFLITEFMPRGSVFQVLEDPRIALDKDRKKAFLMDVAEGMGYLHGCKPQVIHQDLKSLNLLVGEDWTVKVSDFGIARDKERNWLNEMLGSEADDPPTPPEMQPSTMGGMSTATALHDEASQSPNMLPTKMMTRKAAQGGTLQWMAPEHLTNRDVQTTTKSDVYAFGVILWEIATRKKPWKSVPFRRIVEAVGRGERPLVPAAGWEASFKELVDCCWASDPAFRPDFVKIKKMLRKVNVPV
ncbi:hypothetical protein HDU67_004994 [Dinochytrium kinnereticum]|nr:hypothetical protein HDU67_004994 [Dinochytrium kinnereticum]